MFRRKKNICSSSIHRVPELSGQQRDPVSVGAPLAQEERCFLQVHN